MPSPLAEPKSLEQRGTNRGSHLEPVWLVLIVSAVASVAMVAVVLSLADRALDLTDESYYLHWIANPEMYGSSLTQFGFVYHILEVLLGGSVPQMRQVNLVTTVLLATSVGWLLMAESNDPRHKWLGRTQRWVVAGALGASSLGMLSQWLPTPSYNWLALQSILLAFAGIVLILDGSSHKTVLGSLLLAVGGVLLFLAKPSSAMLLGFAVAMYLGAFGRRMWRVLGATIAISAAILVAVMVMIDGSVQAFLGRISSGSEVARIMGSRHTLRSALRVDLPQPADDLLIAFLVAVILTAVVSVAFATCRRGAELFRFGLLLALPTFTLAIVTGAYVTPWEFLSFRGILYAAAPMGAVLAAVAVALAASSRRLGERADLWGLAALLAVSPFIYAFGTTSNYWHAGSNAGIFWMLAAVAAIRAAKGPSWRSRLVLAVLAGQIGAAILLQTGMDAPYRQPTAVTDMSAPITLRSSGSVLLVSDSHGRYARELQDLADLSGFQNGTALIDLTGRTPGALLLLGARPIGTPWVIGGYPGSQSLAEHTFDLTKCSEIGEAWILEEPAGARHLDGALLQRYGRDLQSDYQPVGEVRSPDGQVQRLLRPNAAAPDARGNCGTG